MASLFTVLIAGIQYLIHSQKLGTIQETINPDAIIPITVLSTEEIFGDLEATLRLFDVYDDVFIPDFGSVLVEKPGANGSTALYAREAEADLAQDVYHLDAEVTISGLDDLPSGPYILHGPNLYQAWRLYEDHHDAFTFGVIPENVNQRQTYRALNALSPSAAHRSVPVPSRLYHKPPTTARPLSNTRIAISDTLSLKGVRTSLSSKAWSELYTAKAASTAQFVQKLIDLGAVIVGKTMTGQFDVGTEWVDEEAPWNFRGDGYQDPKGASAGAGAAVAAYPWMGRSVGLDAIEGVRDVAAVDGIYSIRTSSGSLSTHGVLTSSSFDAVGFSSRLIDGLKGFAKIALNNTGTATLPTKVLYPTDFDPDWSEEQKALHDQFIAAIENKLAIKTEFVTLKDVWAKDPPAEASDEGMQEYMKDAFFRSLCYDFYHQYDDFRAAYQDKFAREPYVEATPDFRWDTGKSVTEAEYKEHLARIQVYRVWFDKNIMPLSSKNGSDTVMILPFGTATPHYRTDTPSEPSSIDGITPAVLAPLLQTPQMVAPFAQLPYESTVSGQTEYLPVSGSVMGPKGGDMMVIEVIKQAFELAQWRTRVDVGRLTFPVGDNERNVDDSRVQQDSPAVDEL